jgi:heterodisulfide reductase subunit C
MFLNLSPHGQAAIRALESYTGQTLTACYQCGKCTAGCPAEMDPPPSVIIRLLQLGLFDEALQADSLWSCMTCMTCSERCPKNVSPAAIIEGLKHLHLRKMDARLQVESVQPGLLIDEPRPSIVSAFRKFV